MPTAFEGFKQSGNIIPVKDTIAQNGVIANTKLIKDTVGWSGKNKFNYDAWKSVGISNGTAVFENNGVSLTATANNCYTRYELSDTYPTAAKIPVIEGKTIKLLWKCTETTVKGGVLICPNGQGASAVSAYNNVGKLEYKPVSGIDFVTVRFGVTTSGDTVHYKDIMVIDADILDDTYEPYFGSTAFPRSEQAVLGAKALVYTNSTSQTLGTLVFTKNADDSVTVSPGTASETVFFNFDLMDKGDCLLKPNTQYILSGCPEGGLQDGYRLDLRRNPGGSVVETCYGNEVTFSISDYDNITQFNFVIRIGSGTVISDPITFKPMVRVATDTDPTFVKFAMTNEQLTVKKANDICYTGSHAIQLMVACLIPGDATAPEFFIPWNNPQKKTPTFNNFKVYDRSGSAWTELAQSESPNIQVVSENGFYVNVKLSNSLTSNSEKILKLVGNLVFA